MKLLIKNIDNDGRLALIPNFVETQWTFEIADQNDGDEFARRLADADALVSMSWTKNMPPAPKLRLLQLPGAGTDEIAFDLVRELSVLVEKPGLEVVESRRIRVPRHHTVKLHPTAACGP